VAAGRAWRPKPGRLASQSKRPAWMSMPTRICTSGKVGYATRSGAKREARQLQTRGAPPFRVYACTVGDCRLWHLTKQERHLPE
jgi:hypothetical protein